MTQPTDKDMAKFFDITPQTISNYKHIKSKIGKKRMYEALKFYYSYVINNKEKIKNEQ